MENSHVSEADTQMVKLCVGGTRYITTLETLSARGPNFLTALVTNNIQGRFKSLKDEKGYLFLDRSGMLFEYVLDYLRSGIMPSPPGGISRTRLLQELDYYQISTKQHEITKEGATEGNESAKSDDTSVPADPQRALLTELRDLSATAIYRLRYPTQAFLKKYWIFLTEHMRMAATRGMRSVELVFEEVLAENQRDSSHSSEKAKVVYGPYSHSMGKVDIRDPAIINDLEWCIPSLYGLQAEIVRPNALRISWAAPSAQMADPL